LYLPAWRWWLSVFLVQTCASAVLVVPLGSRCFRGTKKETTLLQYVCISKKVHWPVKKGSAIKSLRSCFFTFFSITLLKVMYCTNIILVSCLSHTHTHTHTHMNSLAARLKFTRHAGSTFLMPHTTDTFQASSMMHVWRRWMGRDKRRSLPTSHVALDWVELVCVTSHLLDETSESSLFFLPVCWEGRTLSSTAHEDTHTHAHAATAGQEAVRYRYETNVGGFYVYKCNFVEGKDVLVAKGKKENRHPLPACRSKNRFQRRLFKLKRFFKKLNTCIACRKGLICLFYCYNIASDLWK